MTEGFQQWGKISMIQKKNEPCPKTDLNNEICELRDIIHN
jgi:hypothetical protein